MHNDEDDEPIQEIGGFILVAFCEQCHLAAQGFVDGKRGTCEGLCRGVSHTSYNFV